MSTSRQSGSRRERDDSRKSSSPHARGDRSRGPRGSRDSRSIHERRERPGRGERAGQQRGSRDGRDRRDERNSGPERPTTRRQLERVPEIPEHITGSELSMEIRGDFRTLPGDMNTLLSRRLVAAFEAVDEDPEVGLAHARAAVDLAARVGAVRECAGIIAYRAGEFAEAAAELKAARRMTGRVDLLPLIADCERALGRPERALAAWDSAEAKQLAGPDLFELRLVVAGARRDMGQPEAAQLLLRIPELEDGLVSPARTRLRYAYADALLASGQREQARTWFSRVAQEDIEADTDAAERVSELDGVVVTPADIDIDAVEQATIE